MDSNYNLYKCAKIEKFYCCVIDLAFNICILLPSQSIKNVSTDSSTSAQSLLQFSSLETVSRAISIDRRISRT